MNVIIILLIVFLLILVPVFFYMLFFDKTYIASHKSEDFIENHEKTPVDTKWKEYVRKENEKFNDSLIC